MWSDHLKLAVIAPELKRWHGFQASNRTYHTFSDVATSHKSNDVPAFIMFVACFQVGRFHFEPFDEKSRNQYPRVGDLSDLHPFASGWLHSSRIRFRPPKWVPQACYSISLVHWTFSSWSKSLNRPISCERIAQSAHQTLHSDPLSSLLVLSRSKSSSKRPALPIIASIETSYWLILFDLPAHKVGSALIGLFTYNLLSVSTRKQCGRTP